MHIRRLTTLIVTLVTLFVFAASAFAQEAAAESSGTDISPLVFLVGAGLIIALGSYLAVNTRTGKDE